MGRPRRTNPERNRVVADCGGLCSAAGMGATVFVYVIRSQLDGTIYVGRTTGVARRLATHNSGGSAFTARHRPWALVVSIEFPDAGIAGRFEKYLKTGSGRAFTRRHLL
jgi:predicted GIY-YIG superfamily endonuclease